LEKTNKVKTFIGFAMRTGKFRMGANASATLKRAELAIVCNSASENTKKDAEKLARKFHCPIIEPKNKTLAEITHKENAKVMAIVDKSLSKAILSNLEEEFIARN
jgi:ribosomal protein L7Ae-like RNA K-turn-binding protein